MSRLPPDARLRQVASSIVSSLPVEFVQLLASERFQEESEVLRRLAAPGRMEEAVAQVGAGEAGWLAEALLERWRAIAEVRLQPAAALLCSEQALPGSTVRLQAVVEGFDEGWQVAWPQGCAVDPEAPEFATVTVPFEVAGFSVTVRVMGKAEGRREILTATWSPGLQLPGGGAD